MDQKRCYGCMKLKQSHPVCEHCGYDERQQNKPHQLPVGTILHGQYRVGKVLGQGGFGITYVGWDLVLDMPVAIKEFYPNGMVTRDCSQTLNLSGCEESWRSFVDNSRGRFLAEARTLAQLCDVPEIVHIRYFFEENNTAYIIMEYLQGMDLRQYVASKGGRLSAEETLQILKSVMGALSLVHGAGLVHRDISPDNIMLTGNGKVKLLDFGAAKSVEHADADQPLPQSTQAIVKHGFAPIEQYQRRGSLGPWTDVYALCGTMYYCMTGQVPADAPERMADDIHPDWTSIPGLTRQQISVLEMGMALQAKNRLQSVRELQASLYQDARNTVKRSGPEAGYKPTERVIAVDDPVPVRQYGSGSPINEKDAVYEDAKKRMVGIDPESYQEAIRLFESIPEWRDSAEQIAICRERIEKLRHEKEVRDANIKKKRRIARIARNTVCVAILVAFILIFINRFGQKYSISTAVRFPDIVDAGDTICFGKYEQDNITSNGKEEIEWLVLDVKDGKALLISKYALDYMTYYSDDISDSAWPFSGDITWETCVLREWLNNDFLNGAFSAAEKKRVLKVTVEAHQNPYDVTDSGKNTQDSVFLLSVTEAFAYFDSDIERQCQPTDYAITKGAYVSSNNNCLWLLRTPGEVQSWLSAINTLGNYYAGSSGDESAIRPALWINIGR